MRRLGFAVALLLAGAIGADASHLGDGKKHRIVYQLDDPGVDKARFVLNNIRNHVNGVGGWQNVESLELVVFGPALQHFVAKGIDPEINRSDRARGQGAAAGRGGPDHGASGAGVQLHPALTCVVY